MEDLPAIDRRLIESALPPDAAMRFLAEVRPAVALTHAAPGTRVASHLGGRPRLEADDTWPEYLDRPLSLIAVIDLGELAGLTVGAGLPRATLPAPWALHQAFRVRQVSRISVGPLADAVARPERRCAGAPEPWPSRRRRDAFALE